MDSGVAATPHRRHMVIALALVALMAALPLMVGTYPRYIVTMWLIYAIAAIGLFIPMGLAGIYSFGHGGFMLIGAYVTGVAMANWGWPLWMAMPLWNRSRRPFSKATS